MLTMRINKGLDETGVRFRCRGLEPQRLEKDMIEPAILRCGEPHRHAAPEPETSPCAA
jgi:hypothetical protein